MIRRARPDDVATIAALINELATYEREPDAANATESDLRAALFGEAPAVFVESVGASTAQPGLAMQVSGS